MEVGVGCPAPLHGPWMGRATPTPSRLVTPTVTLGILRVSAACVRTGEMALPARPGGTSGRGFTTRESGGRDGQRRSEPFLDLLTIPLISLFFDSEVTGATGVVAVFTAVQPPWLGWGGLTPWAKTHSSQGADPILGLANLDHHGSWS